MKSEKRRRARVTSIRWFPDELSVVEAAASAIGVPVGAFARDAALGAVRRLGDSTRPSDADCPACTTSAEVCAGIAGCCDVCAEVGRLSMHRRESVL